MRLSRCYSFGQTRPQGVLDIKGMLDMSGLKKVVVAGVVALVSVLGVTSVSAGATGNVMADRFCC